MTHVYSYLCRKEYVMPAVVLLKPSHSKPFNARLSASSTGILLLHPPEQHALRRLLWQTQAPWLDPTRECAPSHPHTNYMPINICNPL